MSRVSLLLALVLAAGCQHRQLADGVSACVEAPTGADRWLAPGSMLVVGELHGTSEIPSVISALACSPSRSTETVVALEFPVAERAAVDRFLRTGSVAELLSSAFWRGEFQDGRRSQAMLQLLQRLRQLRAEGRNLEVVLFVGGGAGLSHDEGMARELANAHAEHPLAAFLVLVGSVHAKKSIGTPWDPEFKAMAWHLARLVPATKSVLATYAAGTAWVCCKPDHCAAHDYEANGSSANLAFIDGESAPGFDGSLFVGSIHASPPATSGR
jgi:hypothetical protein